MDACWISSALRYGWVFFDDVIHPNGITMISRNVTKKRVHGTTEAPGTLLCLPCSTGRLAGRLLGGRGIVVGKVVSLRGEKLVLAPTIAPERAAARARQALDQSRIVQVDGAVADVVDDGPVVVITLHTKDDCAPWRAIQEGLDGAPELVELRCGDAPPGDPQVGNAVADHIVEDLQHLAMDDAADQQLGEQAAAREVVNDGVEELLGGFIGRTVDEALRIDDAVQAAQGIEAALLEGRQAGSGAAAC